MATKTTKREASKVSPAGRYKWRDEKTGRVRGVEIARPAKGPSSISVAQIRRAIDELNAAKRSK